MEEKLTPVQWVASLLLWGLIFYGLWQFGGWLFVEVMSLTPKKLAIGSIALTAIPFCLLIISGIVGQQGGMTVTGSLTVLSFSLSVPGLIASGIWYLFAS